MKFRLLSALCLLALGAADVSARPLDRLRTRRGGCVLQPCAPACAAGQPVVRPAYLPANLPAAVAQPACAGGNCGAPQGRYTLFPRR